MMASQTLLSILVGVAVLVTAVSPVILMVLIIKDWKQKQIW